MANFSDIYAKDADLAGVVPIDLTASLSEVVQDDDGYGAVMRLIESVEHYNAFEREPGGLALPSFSLEGFDGERKASMIASILEWLRKVMKALFDEMAGLEGVMRLIAGRALNLKELSRDRKVKSAISNGSSFEINTRVINLCIRSSPVDTIGELYGHLRNLDALVRAYYTYDPLHELSHVMHAVQASRDPEGVRHALARVSPRKLAQSKVLFPHPENDEWLASTNLLGNHRLVLKQRMNAATADAEVNALVRLVPSELSPRPVPASVEFSRFGLGQSDQCLTLIHDLAKHLVTINSTSARITRNAGLSQLTRALQKLEVDSRMSASDGTVVAQLGATAALVEHYIDWIVNPYNGLYGLTCRNLRAALNVCELNAQ